MRGSRPVPSHDRRVRRHLSAWQRHRDRKSTRLNSSHSQISYAVFCLKKKKTLTCVSILQQGAPTITRVSLEMGGQSPNILFVDAYLEKAHPAAFNNVFGNAGQDLYAG